MDKQDEQDKIIRVFPRQTSYTPDDSSAIIGMPTLFHSTFLPSKNIHIHISVTFTWDIPIARKLKKEYELFFRNVHIGGPAFNDPGDEFVIGLYVKKGIVFTSRGCNKKCTFCFVPKREGKLRELEIKDGWILNDNNILQCSNSHISRVFEMLKRQPYPIEFKGGIDKTILKESHRQLFDSVKIKSIWLSCDTDSGLKPLYKASQILEGISIEKKRCTVMIGFNNESILNAEKRLNKVYNLGFLPFAQLYRSTSEIHYTQTWKDLSRKWSRPIIYRSKSFLSS
jgi:hypothetical protein